MILFNMTKQNPATKLIKDHGTGEAYSSFSYSSLQ